MCYERRDEEFAKVCLERDELKKKLEDREQYHDFCHRAYNNELQIWRTEVDKLRKAIEHIAKTGDACKYCEHFNGKDCTHERGEWCEPGDSFWEWKGLEDDRG